MPGVIYDLQGHVLFLRTICADLRPGSLGGRGKIKGFSPSSASRMRRFLRTSEAEYSVFITLTYPGAFPVDGRTVKEHLRRFLQELSRVARRRRLDGKATAEPVKEFSAFWFLEFQARGAPHFHIFTTDTFDRDWVASRWYEIVGSDDLRHLRAGTRIEFLRGGRRGACGYAAKYAAKSVQKEVPENFANCGRFWGVVGNRRCQAATIVFPVEVMEKQVYRDFRAELHGILQRNVQSVRIKVVSPGRRWAYLSNDDLVWAVRALIMRYGALGLPLGAFCEFPTMGMVELEDVAL